jgi:hypothetical protein
MSGQRWLVLQPRGPLYALTQYWVCYEIDAPMIGVLSVIGEVVAAQVLNLLGRCA